MTQIVLRVGLTRRYALDISATQLGGMHKCTVTEDAPPKKTGGEENLTREAFEASAPALWHGSLPLPTLLGIRSAGRGDRNVLHHVEIIPEFGKKKWHVKEISG
ncbi:hypothetical protein ACLOJK_013676 [Asimina triloba]